MSRVLKVLREVTRAESTHRASPSASEAEQEEQSGADVNADQQIRSFRLRIVIIDAGELVSDGNIAGAGSESLKHHQERTVDVGRGFS